MGNEGGIMILTINGREYEPRITMGSLIRAEEQMGHSFGETPLRDTVWLIWGALQTDPDPPTFDEVAESLSPGEAQQFVSQAFAAKNP
jgi:hypothetical protein